MMMMSEDTSLPTARKRASRWFKQTKGVRWLSSRRMKELVRRKRESGCWASKASYRAKGVSGIIQGSAVWSDRIKELGTQGSKWQMIQDAHRRKKMERISEQARRRASQLFIERARNRTPVPFDQLHERMTNCHRFPFSRSSDNRKKTKMAAK